MPEVPYTGNIITSEGLGPDREKVKATTEMPILEDKPALHHLLGMVKYLTQYVPGEAEIAAPLQELVRKDVAWQRRLNT